MKTLAVILALVLSTNLLMAQHDLNFRDGNVRGQSVHQASAVHGNGGLVSLVSLNPSVPHDVYPVIIGMYPDVFSRTIRSIKALWFDSDQVRVAKQAIGANGASSHQIAEIMRLLSFESSRLEIAKFGYQFVDDPANFYVVNDVFWFSSSTRELDRYINNY